MAKIIKMKPQSREKGVVEGMKSVPFEEIMKGLPQKDKELIESLGIKSIDQIFDLLALGGLDPDKVVKHALDTDCIEEFQQRDLAFDEDDPRGEAFRLLSEMKDEEADNLPSHLFLNTDDVQEYHLRIKLNDAPVKIWRELKVPSNISLALLAKFLIHAMGWGDCHLHQFRKKDIFYKSSNDLEEMKGMYGDFGNRYRNLNEEDYTLAEVLPAKGDRMVFEYDFGDSWMHDVWVKGIREYGPDEPREVQLVKGQGACPPEDCGGVWGYEDLLMLRSKKRKSREEKERLDWYAMEAPYFDPDEYDLEDEQSFIEDFWEYVNSRR
ncbi:MAG: plasmid pRiA4b ORF-3 family protein [Bacteroidaceae bacterium]|nr:plasmid pRiA4b ORF-3 family protein [Bacteroidaceae bacterium]